MFRQQVFLQSGFRDFHNRTFNIIFRQWLFRLSSFRHNPSTTTILTLGLSTQSFENYYFENRVFDTKIFRQRLFQHSGFLHNLAIPTILSYSVDFRLNLSTTIISTQSFDNDYFDKLFQQRLFRHTLSTTIISTHSFDNYYFDTIFSQQFFGLWRYFANRWNCYNIWSILPN